MLVFFIAARRPGLPRGQFSGPWLFSTAEARTSNSSSSSSSGAVRRAFVRLRVPGDPNLPRHHTPHGRRETGRRERHAATTRATCRLHRRRGGGFFPRTAAALHRTPAAQQQQRRALLRPCHAMSCLVTGPCHAELRALLAQARPVPWRRPSGTHAASRRSRHMVRARRRLRARLVITAPTRPAGPSAPSVISVLFSSRRRGVAPPRARTSARALPRARPPRAPRRARSSAGEAVEKEGPPYPHARRATPTCGRFETAGLRDASVMRHRARVRARNPSNTSLLIRDTDDGWLPSVGHALRASSCVVVCETGDV